MDKKIKRQALKYTMLDDDLYQRTIDIVLLKCLGEEQAKVAVREVHDGICEAH
jgi:hypothetical protein